MTLADQQARDSIRNELNRNLFVEAGAGTGKTSELVNRIVGLVLSGSAQLNQIAAITFTEAAAAELRERVRLAFEARIVDADTTDVDRARCVVARSQLDEAAISTIHSFAQRLLKANPLEAGLPASFDVVDQIQSRVAFVSRWHGVLNDTLASPQPLDPDLDVVLRTAVVLGAQTSHLRSLMSELEKQWHDLPDFLKTLPVNKPQADFESVSVALRSVRTASQVCQDPADLLCVAYAPIDEFVTQYLASAHLDDRGRLALVHLGAGLKLPSNKGKAANWPDDSKAVLLEAWGTARELMEDVRNQYQRWVIDQLVRLLGRRVLDDVEVRQAEGKLEFQDLLVFAHNLLVEHASVRRFARMNYRFVMVDEFQDTDSLQANIVALLTSPSEGSDPAGRFTVGDPKQSIYRFRRADPYLFSSTRAQSSARDVVRLNTNFRTLPAVVDWVNDCFGQLLSESMPDEDLSLIAGRTGHFEGSVTLLGNEREKGSILTPAMRAEEAQDIVEHIRTLREDGWVVHHGADLRPAAYADVTILLPTRTSLPALERALSAGGVPYRIESRALIWATQELRDVLSIARAVEDPFDSVSLVAALRSVAFACSDVELFNWKSSGGSWSYLDETPESLASSPIALAMVSLRALHQRRYWLSVPEMLQTIMEERSMFELAFAKDRQRETWARLKFLVDRARSWAEDGGSSMRAFLEWTAVQTDEKADALETIVPEADDDAVRIMTVHASKGLEFPVVVVSGLNSSRDLTGSTRVLWKEGQPLVRFGAQDLRFESDGFTELAAIEKTDDENEQLRLAYVAATRARDHLLISVHRIAGAPSLASKIAAVATNRPYAPPATTSPPPLAMPRTHTTEQATLDLFAEPVAETFKNDGPMARTVAAIEAGRRPTWLSGTKVVERLVGRYVPPVLAEGVFDQDAARNLGSAVHKLLELSELEKRPTREDCQLIANEFNIAGRLDDIERSLELAYRSSPIAEALAGRYWREVDLAAPVQDEGPSLIVGGQADLVYERSDDLVVIDYKTDPVIDEDGIASLIARYRWQLLTYANALQSATGRKVVEASILLISPYLDRARVVPVEDLSASLDEFRQRVTATKP